MKATVRHDCGIRRSVELLDVVDAEHGEVYVRWSLGEIFAVEVQTGRLRPTAEQSPVIAKWTLIGKGLARARARLARREAELRIPVAERPEQLALDHAKYLT